MRDFEVQKKITFSKGIEIYLLKILKNTIFNHRIIIPKNQIEEILSEYRIEHEREKRLIARNFLYKLLSCHYGISNYELCFNFYRKPFLKNANVNFSISYSNDFVLIGVAEGKKIGVDIEHLDIKLNIDEVAPTIMTINELYKLQEYSNEFVRRICFFKTFSFKESIVKAFGTGLYYDVRNLNTLGIGKYMYCDTEFTCEELNLDLNDHVSAICYEN